MLRRALPSGGSVSFISTFLVSTVSSMATLAAEKQKNTHRDTASLSETGLRTPDGKTEGKQVKRERSVNRAVTLLQ